MPVEAERRASDRWHPYLIAAAVIIIFGQTLFFGFVNYDDDELVYNNSAYLAKWENLGHAFAGHAFAGAGGASVYYRPILLVTTIVDYHIWGLRPFGYHLTNLLLHCFTSLLLYYLVRRLTGNSMSALFSGLIFSLHPVQTEAVAWIAGRNDLLLGFFVMLMMTAHVRGGFSRKPLGWRALTVAAAALALFTKESAAFFLLLLPLYDLTAGRRSGKRLFPDDAKLEYASIGILLGLYFAIRWSLFGALIGAERLYGATPLPDRIARVPAIIAGHIQIMVFPVNLSVAHPLHELRWLAPPWSVAAIFITAAIPVIVYMTGKSDKVILFGWLWFLAGFLPLFGIIPMPLPILEHRLYVPLAGAAFAVPILAGTALKRLMPGKTIRFILYASCLMAAIISITRLPVWENGVTLFEDAVRKAPTDLRSYYSLATAYVEEGKPEHAIGALERYVELAPSDIRGTTYLRELYYRAGMKDGVLRVTKLMQRAEPRNPRRMIEVGVAYEEMNKLDSARIWYSRVGMTDPGNPDLITRIASIQERTGEADSAIASYREAVKRDPSDEEAVMGLSRLLRNKGDRAGGMRVLEEFVNTSRPSDDAVQALVAMVLAGGDTARAMKLAAQFHLGQAAKELQ